MGFVWKVQKSCDKFWKVQKSKVMDNFDLSYDNFDLSYDNFDKVENFDLSYDNFDFRIRNSGPRMYEDPQ